MVPASLLRFLAFAAAVYASTALALSLDPYAFLDAQAVAGLERHSVPGVAHAVIEDGSITRVAAHGPVPRAEG